LNTHVRYSHVRDDLLKMIVELVGNHYDEVQEVIMAIKNEVVKLAEEGDRSRAAFDFALHNERDTVVDGACLLPSPLFDKSHWAWVMTMPTDRAVVARFIGHHRHALKYMEQKSNCTIEMVTNQTKEKYILVIGKRAMDVADGLCIVERRIREIKARPTEK
jgi:hypothetical protein